MPEDGENDGKEIYAAEIERTLNAVIISWENDDISICEMTKQLEGVIEVVDNKIDYNQFIRKNNLKDSKDS